MDKFVEVYRILKEYSFEIDETNKDYLCIICKNILSNAHSGPCGCRFCYDCIGEFLNSEEEFCPGNTNECKQEKLNLSENIHYEPSVNTRISKLNVKCSNKSCQFKDEIRKIENHIRVCNFQPIDCPYLNIGCNQSNLISDDMKNHLLSDIVPHSNLLLELIENMRNEMESLKKDIGELEDENKSLKDENKTVKNEIETIKLENQKAISELEKKEKENSDEIVELNEEMIALKNENRYLKNDIENMQIDKTNKNIDNVIETMKTNTEQQTVDIDEIKVKLENQQEEFMKKFDEINITKENLMRKSNEIDEMMKNSINKQIKDLQMKIYEIRGEFDWKIDDFSKLERDKQIYSKPFYAFSNGYKICLSINIGKLLNNIFLHVYLHLMRAEFDDDLLWPCKLDININLINQNNNQIYKSEKIKYNNRKNYSKWKKPSNQRNEGIHFFSISLLNIDKLLKNDQLLIESKTNIPQ